MTLLSMRPAKSKAGQFNLSKMDVTPIRHLSILYLIFGLISLSSLPQCVAQCTDYNSMGYCYDLVRTPMPWDVAQDYCTDRGGRLVAIYNDSVQAAVRSKLQAENYTGDIWTGGRQEEPNNWIGQPQSLWRWVTDCADCGLETACNGDSGNPMDLALVIDNSNGVTQAELDDIKGDLVPKILQSMTVSSSKVQVSIIRMSDSSNPALSLNPNRADVLNAASQTSLSGSSRNFVTVLNLIRTAVFGTSSDRTNAPNAVIFITAGAGTNSISEIEAAALRNKDAAIRIFAVGVSINAREAELAAISGPPKKLRETYFMYNSTTDVKKFYASERIREKLCAFHKLYISLQTAAITEQGCWGDDQNNRDLPNASNLPPSTMEPTACRQYCFNNGYMFGGTQNGNQCYCGNKFGSYSSQSCFSQCSGNNALYCGGGNANNIYKLNGTFSSWAVSNAQPNNLYTVQWCATLQKEANWQFDDQNCNGQFPFICELYDQNCTSSSSNDYFRVNGKCLYLNNNLSNWYRAREFCIRNGRNLFVMGDETQRAAIASYLTSRNFGPRFVYVGLNRNRYYWVDESGGTEVVLNNFAQSEPQPGDGTTMLKCVYLNPQLQHQWYMSQCAQNFSFICHYKKPAEGYTGNPVISTMLPPVTGVVGTTKSAGTTDNNGGFPAWAIGLIAGLGALLLLLLLLLCLCCCCPCCLWFACCGRCKRRWFWKPKDTPKVADARPKAPVPQKTTVGKMDDINDTYSISSSLAYINQHETMPM